MLKKTGTTIGIILLAIVLSLIGFVAFLTIREYRPEEVESVPVLGTASTGPFSGDTVTVVSFNTGYAGLSDNADFFMDGGKQVKATDTPRMQENVAEIAALIRECGADFTLLQEVDQNSGRTDHVDQTQMYRSLTQSVSAYALNYSCPFVPYPLPPIGSVHSGIQTLTGHPIACAERISLPSPFSWPISTANLKRCLLITRTPIEGSGKELVLVNLHLEAYDDGEGKTAQTAMLFSVLEAEYAKGNYVIAGGDFNQTFPGGLEAYPALETTAWVPDVLDNGVLPDGWRLAYDTAVPSCRLLNQPYDPKSPLTQHYVIDGFILSPNVEAIRVQTLDLGFHASDHNPVSLAVRLK